MKEFVGNNGTVNGWNSEGEITDLWDEVNKWEEQLKPQINVLKNKIEKMKSRI